MTKLTFLGVGGAFSLPSVPGDLNTAPMQSNMVLTADNGKNLLIDCGTDIRYSAQMCGFGALSFDAVYISHEHADHTGGLEWFILNHYFNGLEKQVEKPAMFAHKTVISMLRVMLMPGSGRTLQGVKALEDYVFLNEDQQGNWFYWQDMVFEMIVRMHVPVPYLPMLVWGLRFEANKTKVWISGDSVFMAEGQDGILRAADKADIIFHDCETGFKTGYHAHYDDLKTLPEEVRAKMWLYHYNLDEAAKLDAVADGFLGFVRQGQVFDFG